MYTFEYDGSYIPSMPVAEIQIGKSNTAPALVLRAIVDSGADATIIPVRWLKQIRARKSEKAWMSTTTASRRLIDLYAVSLRIGGFEQRALSVVGSLDMEEAILGRDILNHLIVTLNGLAGVTEIAD